MPGADPAKPVRYAADALTACATELLERSGQPADRARDIAEVLVEGDLLGHPTHGLVLLPLYLREITAGTMPTSGGPRVVADHGSALTWDGNYLPGPWLVRQAIAAARARLEAHPLSSVVIARSHHTACLQAYLPAVTSAGLFVLLVCSDPANRWVAPFGGTSRVYSPNPVAAGIPTEADPILIDVSMSTTAFGQVARAARRGERLPGPWLVDGAGRGSDDPRLLLDGSDGALLPLGGLDLGHKGFALALLVEALTSGLAGHGRAEGDAHWGGSVFLLLIDPDRFGGREAFRRETGFLAAACRAASVPPGGSPVRVPGEGALARRRDQLQHGVRLEPQVLAELKPWFDRFGVPPPRPRD